MSSSPRASTGWSAELDAVPVGLAAAAGMVAVVNPCGFALLPAYAALLVVGEGSAGRVAATGRALAFAGAMTAGFGAVFGAFGLLVSPASGALGRQLPWITLALGVLLLAAGVWLLVGRTLPGLRVATRGGAPLTRSVASMAGFGVAYALASLSCTVGPFLATVVASFGTQSVASGVVVFVAYALGMGLVVAVVSVAIALARTAVIARVRRLGPRVARFGGALLVVAGAYVAYYGWREIRVLRGGTVDDAVVDAAEQIRHGVANGLDRLGVGGVLVVLAVLLTVGLVGSFGRRRGTNRRRT